MIRCPSQCQQVVTEDGLRALLEPEVFAQYTRQTELMRSPDMRECPTCKTVVKGSPSQPEICCSQCTTTFCYFHGLLARIHPHHH